MDFWRPARGRFASVLCAIVFALSAALFAAPAQADDLDVADDALVSSFDLVALRNEMVRVAPRVTKWTRDLRVYVDEEMPLRASERDGLDEHLTHLSSLSGLAITPVAEESRSNFRIYFIPRAAYADHIERNLAPSQRHLVYRLTRSVCSAFYRPTRTRREILRAVIVIPVDSARAQNMLRACIVEETTQMLGLPNDSDTLHHSIFNDSNAEVELTRRDELLVQLLYHPRMAVGMGRRDALRVAREVLPEIRRTPAGLAIASAN